MSFIRPLLCGLSLCTAVPVIAQNAAPPAASFQVGGTIKDADGNPLPNAEVSLIIGDDIKQVTASGADGRFNLGNFAAGKATLQVRSLGYQQHNVNITIGQDAKATLIDIVLKDVPQKLEEVIVKSDEKGRLRSFSEHRNERSNFGHYFDRADIRKKNPGYASELFRMIPGVQVQASSFGGNIVRVRGCRPLLWMDGQRVPGAELDEVARPSDIAGIEFYASNAGLPPEFMDRDNGACGMIVVWSKSQ